MLRIAAALLAALSLHAAPWVALRAPGIELYSDAGERTARQALTRLLQIARVLPPRDAPAPTAVRVFVFASEREYRTFAPTPAPAGFHQSSLERDYIVTHAAAPLPRVVVHEYVHFALSPTPRPAWLEEGLAEFYSNIEFTRSTARLGAPIPEHVQLLNSTPWLSARDLNQPRDLGLRFYATAWALVHMLRAEPQFPEEITEAHLARLRTHLRALRPQSIPLPSTAPEPPAPEPISELTALLLRADLALRTAHTPLAENLLQQATRDFPNSSAALTARGALATTTGDLPAARAFLEQAIATNPTDASAWFELALLDHDPAALARAAELNPNLGEAHLLLGVRATDDGDLDTALLHLHHATRLLPRKSNAWYALAYAQWKQGDPTAARASLQAALRTTLTPEHRTMAETLLQSLP